MPRVKFLKPAVKWAGNRALVKEGKGDQTGDVDEATGVRATSEFFKEGETYDLSDDQARRWTRRGVAEIVGKPAVRELPVPPKEPPTKEAAK